MEINIKALHGSVLSSVYSFTLCKWLVDPCDRNHIFYVSRTARNLEKVADGAGFEFDHNRYKSVYNFILSFGNQIYSKHFDNTAGDFGQRWTGAEL